MAEAKVHLGFCAEVYRTQLARGAHFLHEQPAGAASWQEEVIARLRSDPRVQETVGHLCCYGLTSRDREGTLRPAMKATRWLSSAPEVLSELGRKCPNLGGGEKIHTHQPLLGGRAAAAGEYTPELCRAILQGIQGQLRRDGYAARPQR